MPRKKDEILAEFGTVDIPIVTEDDWKRSMLEVLIDIRDNLEALDDTMQLHWDITKRDANPTRK